MLIYDPYLPYYYTPSYISFKPKPTQRDFTLDVVSYNPEFNGKTFKKHVVEGIETIGVFGDEAFGIRFTNNSAEDVQVRISLDGVDILTGKPADLVINHEMWVVRAYKTLNLKAWHESQTGGSRFVFTSGDKSVALHATGDMSHRGIIAAAVFTETDCPAQAIYQQHYNSGVRRLTSAFPAGSSIGSAGSGTFGSSTMNYSTNSATSSVCSADAASAEVSDHLDIDLRSEASVGAGEYVAQPTHTTTGLKKPELNCVARIRYQWFDDLVSGLQQGKGIPRFQQDGFPTGFAAERRTFADLSMVPKVESTSVITKDNTSRFV